MRIRTDSAQASGEGQRAMAPTRSLFDQAGGQGAVDAAVEEFYQRLLADPQLAPFFAGMPLRRLMGHQRAFLAFALQGPNAYRADRPAAQGQKVHAVRLALRHQL